MEFTFKKNEALQRNKRETLSNFIRDIPTRRILFLLIPRENFLPLWNENISIFNLSNLLFISNYNEYSSWISLC